MKTLDIRDLAGEYENIFNTHELDKTTPKGTDLTFGLESSLDEVLLGQRKKIKVWCFEGNFNEDNPQTESIKSAENFQDENDLCLVTQYQPKLDISLVGFINF